MQIETKMYKYGWDCTETDQVEHPVEALVCKQLGKAACGSQKKSDRISVMCA